MSEGTEFNEVSGQQYGFKLDTVEDIYIDPYDNFKNHYNKGMFDRSEFHIDMDHGSQIEKVRDENSVKRE